MNLSRVPTLLPSKRSEDQAKRAYKMLSDFFRFTWKTCSCFAPLFLDVLSHNFLFTCSYGMNTSCCRTKILVEYFGEDFGDKKCLLYVAYFKVLYGSICNVILGFLYYNSCSMNTYYIFERKINQSRQTYKT